MASLQKLIGKIYELTSPQLLIILLLFISSFLFYWFQIRPSQIKQECIEIADNKSDVFSHFEQKLLSLDESSRQQYLEDIGSKNSKLAQDLKVKYREDLIAQAKGVRIIDKQKAEFYQSCLHSKGL